MDPENVNAPQMSIKNQFEQCLKGFRDLDMALRYPAAGKDPTSPSSDKSQYSDTLNDLLERFAMWAANCAADRSGKSSLDHRLCEASHIREQVLKLLKDLDEALRTGITSIQHPKSPALVGSVSPGQSEDFDDDSIDSDTDDGDEEPIKSDLEYSLLDVTHVVKCLYRFTTVLYQPVPIDRLRKCASINLDSSSDIQYVVNKFPYVPEFLQERLGRANTQRRELLIYNQRHYFDKPAVTEKTTTVKRGSGLVDEDPHRNTIQDAPVNGSEDDDYESGANSDEEVASLINNASIPRGTYKVPAPPKGHEGETVFGNGPFRCLLCYEMISIKSERAWKAHVFTDLMPYLCTFENCTIRDYLFSSRQEWFEHETEIHRREWYCQSCNKTYSSPDGIITHLAESHKDEFEAMKHHPDIEKLFERGIVSKQSCPLCPSDISSTDPKEHLEGTNGADLVGKKTNHVVLAQNTANKTRPASYNYVTYEPAQLQKHLGYHLEQIALSILGGSSHAQYLHGTGSNLAKRSGATAGDNSTATDLNLDIRSTQDADGPTVKKGTTPTKDTQAATVHEISAESKADGEARENNSCKCSDKPKEILDESVGGPRPMSYTGEMEQYFEFLEWRENFRRRFGSKSGTELNYDQRSVFASGLGIFTPSIYNPDIPDSGNPYLDQGRENLNEFDFVPRSPRSPATRLASIDERPGARAIVYGPVPVPSDGTYYEIQAGPSREAYTRDPRHTRLPSPRLNVPNSPTWGSRKSSMQSPSMSRDHFVLLDTEERPSSSSRPNIVSPTIPRAPGPTIPYSPVIPPVIQPMVSPRSPTGFESRTSYKKLNFDDCLQFLMRFVYEQGIASIICSDYTQNKNQLYDLLKDILSEPALKISGMTERLPFIQKEIIVDLAILVLYDVVVLIDDSTTMAFEDGGKRIPRLKKLLNMINNMLLGINGSNRGIHTIRFINSDEWYQITDNSTINRVLDSYTFGGPATIGTALMQKILKPNVFVDEPPSKNKKERRLRKLPRPLLIITVTQGKISGEPGTRLTQAIETVVQSFRAAGFSEDHKAVAFQFLCLGNDKNAQRYIDLAYQDNSNVRHHVDTLSSNQIREIDIDTGITLSQKQQQELLRILLGPINGKFKTLRIESMSDGDDADFDDDASDHMHDWESEPDNQPVIAD